MAATDGEYRKVKRYDPKTMSIVETLVRVGDAPPTPTAQAAPKAAPPEDENDEKPKARTRRPRLRRKKPAKES
jgi:hypothetical protein